MEHGFGSRIDHKFLQQKWQRGCETKYASMPNERKKFSIIQPPPNITGKLHIGHALNNTFQDMLARYKRMKGYNVCWIPGTDHAGIATQKKVEDHLKKKGITKDDLGREKFIEQVWNWKKEFGGTIISQLKQLGCSC